MGVQRTRSTTDCRREYQSTGSISTTSLINITQFVSSRSNELRSATRWHPFSIDLWSCVPTTSKKGNSSVVIEGIALQFPSLRHLNVMNKLDSLHRCSSISMNIESIIIVLHRRHNPFAPGSWTSLQSLRALPRLRSLRVVLYDFHMFPDGPHCEIIAETAISLVDFAFCFRQSGHFGDFVAEAALSRCWSFIEQLRQRIFALSLDEKPGCCVEKDGCGLVVWSKQQYQSSTPTVWSRRK